MASGDTEDPVSLWQIIHATPPVATEQRFAAASKLLLRVSDIPADAPRTAVQVFEWMASAGGLSRKGALPEPGLTLLCDVLRSLPATYPLLRNVSVLLAQLRNAVDVADSMVEASKLGDAPEAERLSSLLALYVQLLSVLLRRSTTSFRPSLDQAIKLLADVTRVAGGSRALAGHDGGTCQTAPMAGLCALCANVLRLTLRALGHAGHKKAFKSLVDDLVPLIGVMFARVPELKSLRRDQGETTWKTVASLRRALANAAATDPGDTWDAVHESANALLGSLFDPVHMEGLESALRCPASTAGAAAAAAAARKAVAGEERPRKKAKLAKKASPAASNDQAGEPESFFYQFSIFRRVDGLLNTGTSEERLGCAALLPTLLEAFITEYRRFCSCRSAGADSAESERKKLQAALPCEFAFFALLAEPLLRNISDGASEHGYDPRMHCFVELWRLVATHAAYRPREDPEQLQSNMLAACCIMLLRRLANSGSAGVLMPQAPEWDGLIHTLRMDASPFERNLQTFWSAICDHCDAASVGSAAVTRNGDAEAPSCLRLAADLLRTYARLSDVPACVEVLVRAFKTANPTHATSLVANDYFGRCLEGVATEITSGKSPGQAVALWEVLSSELRSCGDEDSKRWVEGLFEHIVRGFRISERSVDSFQNLLSNFLDSVVSEHQISCSESFLLELCLFGRQIRAWGMPSAMQALEGRAKHLAAQVALGLGHLAAILTRGSLSSGAQGAVCIRGAVQWLAMLAQERGSASGIEDRTTEVFGDDVQPTAVALALMQLAVQEGEGATAIVVVAGAEARQAVCVWLRLLVQCAEQFPASHAPEDALAMLAKVVAPADAACWQQLAWLGEAAARGPSGTDALRNHTAAAAATRASPRAGGGMPSRPGDVAVAAAKVWSGGFLAESPPQFRDPLIGRLVQLVGDAVADATPTSSGKRRKGATGGRAMLPNGTAPWGVGGALLGLLGALTQLSAAAPVGLPAPTIASAVHALSGAGIRVCKSISSANGSADSNETSACCLAAVIWCLGQLLGMLVRDPSDVGREKVRQAVNLLAGGQEAYGSSTLLASVASIFAHGHLLQRSATEVANALVVLVRVLLKRGVDDAWGDLSEKKAWAAGLIASMIAGGLGSKVTNDGTRICILLPKPTELILDDAGEAEGGFGAALQSQQWCALQFLHALLLTGFAGMRDILSVRFASDYKDSAPMELHPCTGRPPNLPSVPAKVRCGLALAILAQCMEADSQADTVSGSWATRRQELVHMLMPLISMLSARSIKTIALVDAKDEDDNEGSTTANAKLREGASLLINAINRSWPDCEEVSLWHDVWLPLVTDWLGVLAVAELAGAASASSTVILANFAAVRPYGVGGGQEALLDTNAQGSIAECCEALCYNATRERSAHVLECLADRVAIRAATGSSEADPFGAPLLGALGGLSAVLHALPKAPALQIWVAAKIIASAHSAVAVSTKALLSEEASAVARGQFVLLSVLAGRVASDLYAHLAAPLLRENVRGTGRVPHYSLTAAEALLFRIAGVHARAALQMQQQPSAEKAARATQPLQPTQGVSAVDVAIAGALAVSETQFCELMASSYGVMSALFTNVPLDAPRLPAWTMQPHILLEVLKTMLEAVYAAPHGAVAARIAHDVVRLWDAFAKGGVRQVSTSAGRTGQALYFAKVQRATRAFTIMIIAHSLDQQRQWPGIEAATQRSLLRLPIASRPAARQEEADRWKEVVNSVRAGVTPLFSVMEGWDQLKQSLYASLAEPLDAMFRDLYADYQAHSKYRGEA